MSHGTSASRNFLNLAQNFRRLNISDPLTPCLAPRLSSCRRAYATVQTEITPSEFAAHESAILSVPTPQGSNETTTFTPASTSTTPAAAASVLTTIHTWPTLAPSHFLHLPPSTLALPLRRDLLHRAVIYEADSKRAGLASTKHRTEIRGSSRKIRPQKGTGRARLGDKKSPMLVGGGRAHGPKPRDFSTGLQKKVYDKAFRTALSLRWRKGELVVVRSELAGDVMLPEGAGARFLDGLFRGNCWGEGNGRSLLVTLSRERAFWEAAKGVGEHVEVRGLKLGDREIEEEGREMKRRPELKARRVEDKEVKKVDVKSLLETGRVVIEARALKRLLVDHCSDMSLEERRALKAVRV